MKKQLLTILLTLAAMTAGAQTFTVGDFTYKVTDADAKTVSLNKLATTFAGDLVVPSSVENEGTTYTVTRIDANACKSCTGITTITIPASVVSAGDAVFSGCSGVTAIIFEDSENALTANQSGTFRTGSQYTLYLGRDISYGSSGMSSPFSNITSLECGGQMTTLCSRIGMASTSTLQSVSIGVNGGNNIIIPSASGSGAFWGCTKLASITIGDHVATIGGYAFKNCGTDSSVEELVLSLGHGVKTIDFEAFNGCTKLKSVTIPASVTQIVPSAFTGMTGDVTLRMEDGEEPLTLDAPNSNHTNVLFKTAASVTAYMGRTIERTNYYENRAIFGTNLTTLTFGPKVTSIGENEYNGCQKLTGEVLGLTNVKNIGKKAFYSYNTNAMTRIEIGDKLETMGDQAFQNCQKLESIHLPGTLKVVPLEAFENCFALATVILDEGIEEIGNGAFYDTDALTEITIPASVKKIGRAPFYCNNKQQMKRMVIADSDEPLEFANSTSGYNYGRGNITDNIMLDYFYLGRDVIRANTDHSLVYDTHTIEIGEKVTDLGILFWKTGDNTAIEDRVQNVKVHWTTPIAIGNDAFVDKTFNGATLWVPGGTQKAYQDAEGWKKFASVQAWSYIVNFTATGHGTIAVDGEVAANGETKTVRKQNGDVLNNSSFTVTLTPEEGYELRSLTQEDVTEGTPAKEIFKGNASFTNPFTVETAINHDLNYVATFGPITYTISYDLAGGTLPEGSAIASYTTESAAITLPTPTREGYTFAGWTGTDLTEATKTVTIATGSTGNRTYTATWTPIVYKISYDLAGGTVTGNPAEYTIESESFTLKNPTKSNYDFAGWTGTGLTAATMSVTIAKGSTGDRSYAATWKEKVYTVSITGAGVHVSTTTPKFGESVVITIDEDADRTLTSLTVNGQDVTAQVVNNQYTIQNVSGDITIVATFASTKEFITLTQAQVTFSCPQSLDFTEAGGVKAYVASGISDGTLLLTRVYKVPANTGLLLVGSEGATYKVPYADVNSYYTNLLVPVATAQVVPATTGNFTNYLYDTKNGIEGFYKSQAGQLDGQKAFLQLPNDLSDAAYVGLQFNDTATEGGSDLNGDGKTDVADIVKLMNIISGK